LRIEILHFVKFLTILSIVMGSIFFIVGLTQGAPIILAFIDGFIMVIVANVPQGLPATVTSTLSIIALRLGDKNVFVKKLESLETLGSATLIASDKTGTLTMNKMTVKNIVIIN
jgi:sodium/potassium-transporting ATPase subunit alpha